jgi:hypothetical protein
LQTLAEPAHVALHRSLAVAAVLQAGEGATIFTVNRGDP